LLGLEVWESIEEATLQQVSKQAVLKDGGGSVVKVIMHFIPIFQMGNRSVSLVPMYHDHFHNFNCQLVTF